MRRAAFSLLAALGLAFAAGGVRTIVLPQEDAPYAITELTAEVLAGTGPDAGHLRVKATLTNRAKRPIAVVNLGFKAYDEHQKLIATFAGAPTRKDVVIAPDKSLPLSWELADKGAGATTILVAYARAVRFDDRSMWKADDAAVEAGLKKFTDGKFEDAPH